jgi:hypothetical protein
MAEPRASAYADTSQYLRDYCVLLALRLHREVQLARVLRGSDTDESFLGLFLSDAEIDGVLAQLTGATCRVGDADVALEPAIASAKRRIAARLAATRVPLRTRELARLFGLSSAAVEVVLLLLATEVDDRFSRVYAYLQDDVARRRLSVGLALRLLPGTSAAEPAGRRLFAADAPLVRERLVLLDTGGERLPAPLIDRALALDERVAEYLLEHDPLDPRLAGLARVEARCHHREPPGATRELADRLATLWRTPEPPAVLLLGRPGSGKATLVGLAAASCDRAVLTLDGRGLGRQPLDRLDEVLRAADREARLRGAVPHLARLDGLPDDALPRVLDQVRPGWVLSAAHVPWPPREGDPLLVLALPEGDQDARLGAWRTALDGHGPPDAAVTEELAGRFRLTPGQIRRAAETARWQACLREGAGAVPRAEELFESSRRELDPHLARLATKVVAAHGWGDLVLPPPVLAQLHAVEAEVRHEHTVYGSWGFAASLGNSAGVSALFSGQSGTGKTMAAGVLARSLGLDLYKVDLSGVVSKYIGETEKNLAQIFAEADTAGAVLFFDEADALFGKRSEVKDAHDRYANIEISYLLQRMEEYRGIAVLATNFSQNMDEAFTRRLRHVVDFPFPQPPERALIWRGLVSCRAPVADDVDWEFLASAFELTGGNIRNCVLGAAFLAAEEGTDIAMTHLVRAVARELAKLGRPLTRADFAGYYTEARTGRR